MSQPPLKVYAGRCQIRPFSVSDIGMALNIEGESFAFPWSEVMFMTELERENISRCFVAEPVSGRPHSEDFSESHGKNLLAGYIMSWLVADELHITNLAVARACRRQGVAECLVEYAIEDAMGKGAEWCQLEVRCDNAPARALYSKLGFREIGVRKGYYQDGEDAVVMGKDLVI